MGFHPEIQNLEFFQDDYGLKGEDEQDSEDEDDDEDEDDLEVIDGEDSAGGVQSDEE